MGPVRIRLALVLLLFLTLIATPLLAQEQRLIVTVANQVGFPVTNLRAEDFAITLDRTQRTISEAKYVATPLSDIVLLLDTSQVGARVRGQVENMASLFIDRITDEQQMAIVGYGSQAELVQDLTGSQTALKRALGTLRYGNPPRVLDGIYAAINGGFEHSAGRKILVVIGSGADARNRLTRKEVVDTARRHEVSVFGLSFLTGGDLEKVTEETAGDFYRGRELRQVQQAVENLTGLFQGHYELTLPGGSLESGRLRVQVPRGDKYRISYRIAPGE
jgi:VWFA-related protein